MQGRVPVTYIASVIIGALCYVLIMYVIYARQDSDVVSGEVASLNSTPQAAQPAITESHLESTITISQTGENTIAEEPVESKMIATESNSMFSKAYRVKIDAVNIREEPNLRSKVIGRYTYDTILNVIGVSEGWGAIESGGFVYMDLLDEVD